MLSLGTELFLAFWMASYSVGLPSGSPPPVRAATSIFLISLANILPRRASMTAFLCLVVAHLEWPLMMSSLVHRSPRFYRGATAQSGGVGGASHAATRTGPALLPRLTVDCSKVALHQFDWSRATLLQSPARARHEPGVHDCTRLRRYGFSAGPRQRGSSSWHAAS